MLINYNIYYIFQLDCGIDMQEDELKGVVQIAIDSLRAQIIEPEEAAQIDEEVEKAMAIKPVCWILYLYIYLPSCLYYIPILCYYFTV